MTSHGTATQVETPVGRLTLVATEGALAAVIWPDPNRKRLRLPSSLEEGDHPVLEATIEQLLEYFAGARCGFDLPLEPRGTPFQLQAWQALREIPYGETRSYGEQARAIGKPSAARAVGAANGQNPLSIIVPCHRVVGARGQLTGFAGGLDRKEWLLEHERGWRAHDGRASA